jgi:hypothetical protein
MARPKGVVLSNGDEIYAETISSSVDPRQTFNKFMMEKGTFPPTFSKTSTASSIAAHRAK